MAKYERELGWSVQSVPEGLGVGTWRWDIDTRSIHWSEELRRIYGLADTDRAPMTLQAFADLVHPADRGRVIATVSETLSSQRDGHAHRFRILRRDGGVRLVSSRARLVVDEQGRAIALEGVDVDLTADVEEPLAEPPGSHRAIFDAIDDGFCLCETIVDEDGRARDYRILETNDRFEEMTGFVAAVGRTTLELVPDMEPHWIETYARAGLERRTLRFEHSSEAMARVFDVFATPVEPYGRFAIVFRDITAQRQAERALAESDRRSRALFENAGVCLCEEDFSPVLDRLHALRAAGVTDLRAYLESRPAHVRELMDLVVLRDANRFALRLFGAPDDAPLPATLSAVFPEGSEHVFVAEAEALWCGQRFAQIEGRLCRLDGEPFDALLTLVFEGERAERTLVSVVDVSPLKRLEERQQTLIAELNHRVKNSLAMVQAIALQTFRDSHGPQARETFMARLQVLAKAQDLLTRTSWEAAPFDALIAETIAPYATGCAFAPQGPRVTIEPRQVLSFALVLHELCTNAVKYGAASLPQGRIDIVWDLREEAGGRHLRLVWTERGGPPVTPPTRTGFGSRLIARLAPDVRFDYAQEGLVCILDVRLDGGTAADLPSPGA